MGNHEKIKAFSKERIKMMRSLNRVIKQYKDELPDFITPVFDFKNDEVVITLAVDIAKLENYNIEDYEVRRKRV